MDKLPPEKRSWNMSRISNRDTKAEVWLRKQLYHQGFRYYKNYRRIIGTPDIYITRYKVAIYVHGCFWHRHKGCRYAYTPKSRVDFWMNKFDRNIQRDNAVQQELREHGIRYVLIWECTIKKMQKDESISKDVLNRLNDYLKASEPAVLEI